MHSPTCQQSLEFDIAELAALHPPKWKNASKAAIYERVCQDGGAISGKLRFTRWRASTKLDSMDLQPCEINPVPGYYSYSKGQGACWHVNFADPRLFAAYGSSLLAQDEWQVVEHPILGSLREALLQADVPALTREDGRATPVLIANVPRQCVLNVDSQVSAVEVDHSPVWKKFLWPKRSGSERPKGSLYGNAFQRASTEQILLATKILSAPTLSNIIAIAAPTGRGVYTSAQLGDILETVVVAFQAAILETRHQWSSAESVEIHTGWWGCGAFGGNRVVMALMQLVGASLTGVARLVFHFGRPSERFDLDEAIALLEDLRNEPLESWEQINAFVERQGFAWGVSDGN
jgi:hypothetical protein